MPVIALTCWPGDQLYKNVHTDNNAWEPGTPHSQWELYTPDGDES